MSVTNYTPTSYFGCRYSYDKLDNVVYLISAQHVKNVHIDNGEAYIDGLTESPLKLNGFSIELSEDSSLDERYKFQKSVKFSLQGFVPQSTFNGKYYVILRSKNGTKWMVNVDFPSKVTYTFTLNSQQYQTDFSFDSLSNFPTLRLASSIAEPESECIPLMVGGIESLSLLEKMYCDFDSDDNVLYTYGESFKSVEFLKNSLSLVDAYDGDKVTTTIQFNIAFNGYKSSWKYNLLEFVENIYSSIIVPKGGDYTFFSGFHFGLQSSYTVSTNAQKGSSDIITVTLTETSLQGSICASGWSSSSDTSKRWVYVSSVNGIQAYECVGYGQAKYLLQQEVGKNGYPTGRYKALEGYANMFPSLNIIGTFSTVQTFANPECPGTTCQVSTDIPSTLSYTAQTCYTYSYSATCDWSVGGLASYMTVTPSTGTGGNLYSLSICNTKTPTTNESSTFTIASGNNVKVVNVNLSDETSFITPTTANINCLQQNAYFNFDSSCPITVTSIGYRLTYRITNYQLVVQVPRNSGTSSRTWSITVKDCNNTSKTVTINQDKTYERWVDTSEYICNGNASYVKQQRYTGTTSSNINTITSEYRAGSLIQSQDPRCTTTQTRWSFDSHYYCVNGNKFKAEEEEVSYDNGTTWTKTGVTRLGDMVETGSSWCNQSVSYKWVLTSKWICYGDEIPTGMKFLAEYNGGSSTYSAECDSDTTLTSATTKPSGYEYTAMTSAYIGSCVTSIGYFGFAYCSGLTTMTIPSGVTSIGDGAFYRCTGLTSIDIPDSVTSIGDMAFNSCSGLTSIDIPDSVTSIGQYVFSDCYNLTSAIIGSGMTSIGDGTFSNCTSLTSVGLVGSGASIEIPNRVRTIGYDAFRNCRGLTNVTIPDSVTSIGALAFEKCTSLTSVTIGSGIYTIDMGAFDYNSGLVSFTIYATYPPILGNNVFYNTNNCIFYVPSGSLDWYKSASGWSDVSTRIQAIP